jgi:hypothetical protein
MESITINLYNNEDEIERTCKAPSVIRFGTLKKALKLQTQMQDADAEAQFDAVATFLVAFFNDQFTFEDVMRKVSPAEAFTAFRAVTARAAQLSGPENFQTGQG